MKITQSFNAAVHYGKQLAIIERGCSSITNSKIVCRFFYWRIYLREDWVILI